MTRTRARLTPLTLMLAAVLITALGACAPAAPSHPHAASPAAIARHAEATTRAQLHAMQPTAPASAASRAITTHPSHTLSPPSAANPQGLRVLHYTLANGLDVILLEDHSAPVFAYQTWFGVGSSHERPGVTGIAHLFEHLMFKETANLGEGEFDKIMEAHGVETNAATWLDWTMYRAEVPAGLLDKVVELEAERFANMTVDARQLTSEREVVKNERRQRVDNDPEGAMFEALYATAYTQHPYRWPTIGWMRDLDAITLQDCLDFRATWYTPNHATVVLVGDIDPADALAKLNAAYGGLPSGPPPKPNALSPEPKQTTERRRLLAMPLSSPKLLIGYHTPAPHHDDHPALQVLHHILLEGDSSRLIKRLIHDDELVTDASGWLADYAHPGLYELIFTLTPDANPDIVDDTITQAIEAIARDGVTEAEVNKARNLVELEFLRNMQSVGDRAYGLGHYFVTYGAWQALFDATERLSHVTPAQVQRAAQTWLGRNQRTVILAMPLAGPPSDNDSMDDDSMDNDSMDDSTDDNGDE